VRQRLAHLEERFPNLAAAGYDPTSDETGKPPKVGAYNCIAWAAQDPSINIPRTCRFWWPDGIYAYWPSWIVSPDNTVSCFVETFMSLGYRVCDNSRLEPGYSKVVLYAMHVSKRPITPPVRWQDMNDWIPTHMARQLTDETWTSKLGGSEDLNHFTLDAIECYGPPPFHPLFQTFNPNWKNEYGCPVVYMKRHFIVSWVVRSAQYVEWKLRPALRPIRKLIFRLAH